VSRSLTWVGHSTVRLDLDGASLMTDPVLRRGIGHIRRFAAPPATDAFDRVDAVLITHAHHDHLDIPSLRRLPDGLQVLAPASCASLLRRRTRLEVVTVAAGGSVTVGGLAVRVVRADHDGRRVPVGPRQGAVGYVVERIAVYGDTDVFDEMGQLAGELDVALVPVWGWGPRVGPGHLDPDRAAQAVALLRPRLAVPVHWGTLASPGVWWRDDPDEPARRFAARVGELAPATEVKVLRPGERLELPV